MVLLSKRNPLGNIVVALTSVTDYLIVKFLTVVLPVAPSLRPD